MVSAVFALRGSRKRPAIPDEIETTRAFYTKGNETRGKIGILFIHGFTVTPASSGLLISRDWLLPGSGPEVFSFQEVALLKRVGWAGPMRK